MSSNDRIKSEAEIERDRQKRKNILLKIIIGLLIIVIILLLLFRCSGVADKPVISPGTVIGDAPTLDPNAGEYVEPETQQPSQGVAIPGWGSIVIAANTKDVVVDFYNPEANADKYYLTFEIKIPNKDGDAYETVFKSGLVEPGLHLQNITLDRELEAGEYEAIIHVQPYRIPDKSRTNNADLKTKLIVQ